MADIILEPSPRMQYFPEAKVDLAEITSEEVAIALAVDAIMGAVPWKYLGSDAQDTEIAALFAPHKMAFVLEIIEAIRENPNG